MLKFRLQLFGGRGGAIGAGKSSSSTYVSGGKVATVEYSSGGKSRVEKAHMFSNNDGFVKDFEVFSSAIKPPKAYDVTISMASFGTSAYLGSNKEAMQIARKTNVLGAATIGINVNTPKGVSEKQEAYAKKVAVNTITNSAKQFANGVAQGKTTLENFSQVFRKQPALSAREVLDKLR